MRRESREWLVGTGALVLAAASAIGIVYGVTYYSALLWQGLIMMVSVIAGVIAFMLVGIALPLIVGEAILDWLEGEQEDKDAQNEDPPFQFP